MLQVMTEHFKTVYNIIFPFNNENRNIIEFTTKILPVL